LTFYADIVWKQRTDRKQARIRDGDLGEHFRGDALSFDAKRQRWDRSLGIRTHP
jgi:hypothetical protein